MTDIAEGAQAQEGEVQQPTFTNEDFFKYANEQFGETLGREINSIEDLTVEKEVTKEIQTIPDALKGYHEFNTTTGRGMEDYIQSQKDWTQESEDARLTEYLRQTKPHYDNDDIAATIKNMKKQFEPSEDDDVDSSEFQDKARLAKLDYKDLLAQATSTLQSNREKYEAPLPDHKIAEERGMEAFKVDLQETIASTESVKFADLDYKFNKEEFSDIKTLEDVMGLLKGEDGNLDMSKVLDMAVYMRKGSQVLNDLKENTIVNYETEKIKKQNNAQENPKPSHIKGTGDAHAYAKKLFG